MGLKKPETIPLHLSDFSPPCHHAGDCRIAVERVEDICDLLSFHVDLSSVASPGKTAIHSRLTSSHEHFGIPKKAVTRIQNGNTALDPIQPGLSAVFRPSGCLAKISSPCTVIVVHEKKTSSSRFSCISLARVGAARIDWRACRSYTRSPAFRIAGNLHGDYFYRVRVGSHRTRHRLLQGTFVGVDHGSGGVNSLYNCCNNQHALNRHRSHTPDHRLCNHPVLPLFAPDKGLGLQRMKHQSKGDIR